MVAPQLAIVEKLAKWAGERGKRLVVFLEHFKKRSLYTVEKKFAKSARNRLKRDLRKLFYFAKSLTETILLKTARRFTRRPLESVHICGNFGRARQIRRGQP
ncbi:hypothetical protein [Pyrobaculum aerophilum]|uniref:Uncharacterized protein n=2 Tax=Pyrobaculum aerophilum TaxID=13773 RepID=Q8ZSL9_PYRAE|nr:hypothetical protein [Pyrobaculum aerophilum]AAL65094.1 hypothetical protein PAE3685 [Pyrobaculum aerophilum str. IM2]MCX8136810.1 hypothetical protein [Pyrobaculum aerophilum]HII47779.1 hypothetical protein [Pyrobaculum aerophilum]